jgi:hypothetical protein
MAEHEIIKYTKRAYKVSRDGNKSWKEKIVEIVIDVAIIFFAVTLSLYLHHRSEVKAERALEKEFLLGLREDLIKDTVELRSDSSTYARVARGFRYFLSLANPVADSRPDSVDFYRHVLFNITNPHPNSSRFEGLKSTGKLYIIQDKKLLNDILDLYQERIPILLLSTGSFSDFKENRLAVYLENNFISTDSTNNMRELVKSHVLQNYLKKRGFIPEIEARYHGVIEQCKLILARINEEYPEN